MTTRDPIGKGGVWVWESLTKYTDADGTDLPAVAEWYVLPHNGDLKRSLVIVQWDEDGDLKEGVWTIEQLFNGVIPQSLETESKRRKMVALQVSLRYLLNHHWSFGGTP